MTKRFDQREMDALAADIKAVMDKHELCELKVDNETRIGYAGEDFYFIGVNPVSVKPDWYVKQMSGRAMDKYSQALRNLKGR